VVRHALSDGAWKRIAKLLPEGGSGGGRPWNDHRQTLNGILWVLRTGAPWRDLPSRFGPWKSVYGRYNRWSKDGTFDTILRTLQGELDAKGQIDRDLWCLDGTSVRATRAASGGRRGEPDEPRDHALGRSRGGLGTKFHLLCDSTGIPLAVELSPGQTHDSQRFETTMEAVRIPQRGGPPRRRPKRLAADKAYGSLAIRQWLRRHKIRAVIPTKANERRRPGFDRDAYRGRSVVERCISWLKESRRVATRYEKLARISRHDPASHDRAPLAGSWQPCRPHDGGWPILLTPRPGAGHGHGDGHGPRITDHGPRITDHGPRPRVQQPLPDLA